MSMEDKLQKQIDERIRKLVPEILQGSAFTARKLTDTPTDNLSVVNRKYTNLNGTLANRPSSSVATMGQSYFSTNTNTRITYNAFTSVWSNGVGSVVAQG